MQNDNIPPQTHDVLAKSAINSTSHGQSGHTGFRKALAALGTAAPTPKLLCTLECNRHGGMQWLQTSMPCCTWSAQITNTPFKACDDTHHCSLVSNINLLLLINKAIVAPHFSLWSVPFCASAAQENVDMMSEYLPLKHFKAIYVVDLCHSLCEQAKLKVKAKGWQNVHVVEGDACEFRVPEGEATLITFSYSLSSK